MIASYVLRGAAKRKKTRPVCHARGLVSRASGLRRRYATLDTEPPVAACTSALFFLFFAGFFPFFSGKLCRKKLEEFGKVTSIPVMGGRGG